MNKNSLPVLYICHARNEKVKETGLMLISEEINPLFIFQDGISGGEENKNYNGWTKSKEEIRKICKERKSLGLETSYYESLKPHGPAWGPVTAMKWALESNIESLCIIEDDILIHREFVPTIKECLEKYKDNDTICWVGGGHPLDCNKKYLKTKTAKLQAWASWKNKLLPIIECFEKIEKWNPYGKNNMILRNLCLKTKVFLWKEFKRDLKTPNWEWDYRFLQVQLKKGYFGITPTTRLHKNIGFDGSGNGNCVAVGNYKEDYEEELIQKFKARISDDFIDERLEAKLEWERYGRLDQAFLKIKNKLKKRIQDVFPFGKQIPKNRG
jgi:hypothetical protein